METGGLNWTFIVASDQTCRMGDYVLRAENSNGWNWWCVYFKKVKIAEVETIYLPTLASAKTACEKAYYEHLKTQP